MAVKLCCRKEGQTASDRRWHLGYPSASTSTLWSLVYLNETSLSWKKKTARDNHMLLYAEDDDIYDALKSWGTNQRVWSVWSKWRPEGLKRTGLWSMTSDNENEWPTEERNDKEDKVLQAMPGLRWQLFLKLSWQMTNIYKEKDRIKNKWWRAGQIFGYWQTRGDTTSSSHFRSDWRRISMRRYPISLKTDYYT